MAKRTTTKKRPRSAPKRYRILALDGGGIRGIMTARWLSHLERELGDRPLREFFDIVAGTSTGSILACAIAAGFRARDVEDLYRTYGREVFPAPASRRWSRLRRTFSEGLSAPKYDDDGLERVLRRQFSDRTLGDLPPSPILLVTSYNTLTRQSTVIKNSRDRYASLPLWEAAKASCSAPTYFPAHLASMHDTVAPLIDGGVVANNPAACALAEGVKENSLRSRGRVPLDRFVVASYGTGSLTRAITAGEAREWGAIEWAVPVIDVLMDGACDATDYVVRQLLADDRYFRFQTRLEKAFDDMDDSSRTNLEALLNLAEHFMQVEGGDDRTKALAQLVR